MVPVLESLLLLETCLLTVYCVPDPVKECGEALVNQAVTCACPAPALTTLTVAILEAKGKEGEQETKAGAWSPAGEK